MISAHGMSFGYKRSESIINDLSWNFEQGAVTAVTGPSGRGKSTLLYLIGLLLTPWAGVIRRGETDLTRMSDLKRSRFRAEQVGFVFQDAALDPTRTVLDNIVESHIYNNLRRREAVNRAEALMEHFDVGLRADHKPGEVSGGQAQRIALCRALVSRPELVLADEPTGNLDPATASVVVEAFTEMAADEGKTVIVATHDPDVVAACDQVVEL